MSHPMFGLRGTEALQKFRGSLRGESNLRDAKTTPIISRAFRDSDGSYQSSHHAKDYRRNGTAASYIKPSVDHAVVLAQSQRPLVANEPLSSRMPRISPNVSASKGQQRQQHTPATAVRDSIALAAVIPCDSVWDQTTLDTKLEKLSRHQMELLGQVATTTPDAYDESGQATSRGIHSLHSKSWCALPEMERRQQREMSPPQQHLPELYAAQIPALEQIDAIAMQVHRHVMEMHERIENLAQMHSPSLPPNVTHRIHSISADVHKKLLEMSQQMDALAQKLPQFRVPRLMIPTLPPHVLPAGDMPLKNSPLKSRVKSARPAVAVAGGGRGITLWDSVPQLHACFVAIADGDSSLLLTVQQVKKEDIRSKCVSLSRWNGFLRQQKAYTKLGFDKNLCVQAFQLALNCNGCAFDETRVNFFGFCQVGLGFRV